MRIPFNAQMAADLESHSPGVTQYIMEQPTNRITMMATSPPPAPKAPAPKVQFVFAPMPPALQDIAPVDNHPRYAATGKRIDGVEEPEAQADEHQAAAAEAVEALMVAVEDRMKKEYQADRAMYMRLGITEADYIASQKVSKGLEPLIVR